MPKVRRNFVKPGCSSQRLTKYEMDRQRNIERNSAVLSALGLKTMSKALFGSNLTAKKKTIKEGKSKINCCNDDEKYQLCEDEEGMSSSEDVASSRFQANKVDEQAKALAELSKALTKHTRTMAVLQDIVRVLAVKAAVDPTDIVELIEMSNNEEGASDKRGDAASIDLSKD